MVANALFVPSTATRRPKRESCTHHLENRGARVRLPNPVRKNPPKFRPSVGEPRGGQDGGRNLSGIFRPNLLAPEATHHDQKFRRPRGERTQVSRLGSHGDRDDGVWISDRAI